MVYVRFSNCREYSLCTDLCSEHTRNQRALLFYTNRKWSKKWSRAKAPPITLKMFLQMFIGYFFCFSKLFLELSHHYPQLILLQLWAALSFLLRIARGENSIHRKHTQKNLSFSLLSIIYIVTSVNTLLNLLKCCSEWACATHTHLGYTAMDAKISWLQKEAQTTTLSLCFWLKQAQTALLTSTFTTVLQTGGKHTICRHLHKTWEANIPSHNNRCLGLDSRLVFMLITHLQDVSSVARVTPLTPEGFDSFILRPISGLLVT